MLILTSCSIVIFLLGSKVSNIKIKSYFSAADFTVKTIAAYCVISFFIRYIAGIAGSAAEMIFSGVDMSVGTEMMNYENPKTIAITGGLRLHRSSCYRRAYVSRLCYEKPIQSRSEIRNYYEFAAFRSYAR